MTDKPQTTALFIPLNGEYSDAFADGTKTKELRLYGARWNFETCRIGREVILSRGYGTKNRMRKKIIGVSVTNKLKLDFIKIYGEGKVCIEIELTSLDNIWEAQFPTNMGKQINLPPVA